jgi:6-pyruvoyl-tetrahydropterin synthase
MQRFPRDKVLGMTVDFGALKDILKFLDHKMLVSEHDDVFLNSGLFEPEGVVVIPGKNPNVEGVALYAMNEAVDALAKLYPGEGVSYHIEVEVAETENNVFTLQRTVTI